MVVFSVRFPDEKVGQFPMAYVVRKAGSNLSETAVMDFIAKQVGICFTDYCQVLVCYKTSLKQSRPDNNFLQY